MIEELVKQQFPGSTCDKKNGQIFFHYKTREAKINFSLDGKQAYITDLVSFNRNSILKSIENIFKEINCEKISVFPNGDEKFWKENGYKQDGWDDLSLTYIKEI